MNVVHYGTPPLTYASGESGSPLGGDSAGAFSGAEPFDEDFFPRFEVITSGSSEAVLFFPWSGEFLILPFLTASFVEAVAPWSPLHLPPTARPPASCSAWDSARSRAGGLDT